MCARTQVARLSLQLRCLETLKASNLERVAWHRRLWSHRGSGLPRPSDVPSAWDSDTKQVLQPRLVKQVRVNANRLTHARRINARCLVRCGNAQTVQAYTSPGKYEQAAHIAYSSLLFPCLHFICLVNGEDSGEGRNMSRLLLFSWWCLGLLLQKLCRSEIRLFPLRFLHVGQCFHTWWPYSYLKHNYLLIK